MKQIDIFINSYFSRLFLEFAIGCLYIPYGNDLELFLVYWLNYLE